MPILRLSVQSKNLVLAFFFAKAPRPTFLAGKNTDYRLSSFDFWTLFFLNLLNILKKYSFKYEIKISIERTGCEIVSCKSLDFIFLKRGDLSFGKVQYLKNFQSFDLF